MLLRIHALKSFGMITTHSRVNITAGIVLNITPDATTVIWCVLQLM